MAIANSDGSIVLTTKVDTKGAKKGLTTLKDMVGTVSKGLLAIGAAAATATVAITKMAVDAYADYEQLVGGVETLFKGSADKVMKYAENAFATAGISANEYMEQVTSFSASLISSTAGDTEKAADIADMALTDMADNANKMGTPLENIQTAYQGFAKQQYMLLDNLKLGYGGTKTEMERLLKDAENYSKVELGKEVSFDISNLADVYTAINLIQQKLDITGTTAKEAEGTILGSAAMMKAAWQNTLTAISGGGDIDKAINNLVYSIQTYFKNILPVVETALQGIGILVERAAPMLIETVARAVIKAIPSLVAAVYQMVFSLFKGIGQGFAALFSGEAEKQLEKQTNEIAASVDNQNELTEAVKETNKEVKRGLAGFDEINTLSKESADNQAEDLTIPTISGGAGVDSSAIDKIATKIDETLLEIMAIVGPSMIAIGLILLFTGNIAWGIGFIVAGAVTVGVVMQQASQFDYNGVIQMLTTIMGIAGGALLALGIILLWIGGVVGKGVAIGMIIAGAALIVGAVAAQAALSPDDIGAWLTLIMGIAAGALLALGIILCMVGSVPVGVGMIIAGSVALVSAVALNFDSVKNSITGWVAVIMAIAGAALLVLGIILVATGVGLPLGLALIAAGAIALVTPIVLNWDAIVDWIKGAWDAVKAFWNKYIAPVFTAKFWLDLAKTCGNGLIAGFEGAINGIIWMFEGLINLVVSGLNLFIKGISTVTGAVGDLIGVDLRIPEIPKASLGRVSIPRLAQGAVIPPNREFLAVLGDQKQGTNIEAPLQTIVDAFNIALAQNGGYNNSNTEVVLELDGREFGRAIVEQGNRENRRIGTRLVIA